MCRNVLRDHAAVRTVLDISTLPPRPFMSWVPAPMWRRISVGPQRFFGWITTGLYDEPVREMMGLSWSERDQRWFVRFGKLVAFVMASTPRRYRLQPRARDAWDRVNGRVAADAPLVESPTRNLPPESERDNPMHYCPVHAARRATYPGHVS